jgi:long-chain fatty acid transport protein
VRCLLLATTCAASGALAAGLDQSGQPVTLLFEPGRYAELGFATVLPSIEGADPAGVASGNVYNPVGALSAGVRADLGDAWSAALIVDEPYGVIVNYDLDYPAGAFPFAGTRAEPDSLGITALLRYRLDDRLSLHGGLRAQRFGGEATLAGTGYGPLAGYTWTGDADWGLGTVFGAAYERPEIALRVALTWGSAIAHDLDAEENFFGPTTTEVTMPQSVNLDLQTGLDPKTLLYGSIRWVDWSGWTVAPAGLLAATGLPLIAFDEDAFTWRLGLGRQLTPAFAAAVELAHETAKGQTMTALDPYDGFTGLGLGGRYALPSGLRLGGGLAFNWLGDADVAAPTGATARFRDNHALAARVSVGFAF